MVYEIESLPIYIALILVAYEMSKMPSNSKLISKIWHVAFVSPVRRIPSFAEFNSIVMVKFSSNQTDRHDI